MDRDSGLQGQVLPNGSVSFRQATGYVTFWDSTVTGQAEESDRLEIKYHKAIRIRAIRLTWVSLTSSTPPAVLGLQPGQVQVGMALYTRRQTESDYQPVVDGSTGRTKVRTKSSLNVFLSKFLCSIS